MKFVYNELRNDYAVLRKEPQSDRISGEVDSLLLGDIAKNLDSLKADLRIPYPIWEKWK